MVEEKTQQRRGTHRQNMRRNAKTAQGASQIKNADERCLLLKKGRKGSRRGGSKSLVFDREGLGEVKTKTLTEFWQKPWEILNGAEDYIKEIKSLRGGSDTNGPG